MLTTLPDTSANLAIALLINYSFDLSGYSANELVERWQTQYPLNWLHLAVIEALYQGRYKAVSVQQILVFWQRRDQATYHFNMEFERMVCSKFPQNLTSSPAPALPPAKKSPIVEKVTTPQLPAATTPQLPPAKIRNGYQYSNTATLQLKSSEQKASLVEEEEKQEARENKTVLKSPLSGKLASSATLQLSSAVSQKQIAPESPPPSPSPSHQRQPKLLPPATIHAPIGQFTPEKSDRSDSFTSKLKAMSGEQNRSVGSGE
ncbi:MULTISPECIES: hypothetical protein [unclassified Nostoc]|uniref:hypothetical protein n=1 Tax=unclassified Nostoc TaxID=2593658 RepID=UPI002AD305BD|nr:hypothetical protein [Nostoc sp. DedQUE03]MDZ7971674.1 hypothetical protein [Nostoc sp. DedQUE03]MDZ8048236.1 hypothetical protein [Nostoc sp. DedQUE02]